MSGELQGTTVVAAVRNHVSGNVSGEAVILNMKDGVYYGLSGAVGARIWKLLEEPRSVDEIVGTIQAEFDVQPERCRADVIGVLREVLSKGLVEVRAGQAD